MRILFHHPLSPLSRKVRIQLKEKALAFELVEEKFWERREEYMVMNPACDVPVLVNDEETIIADGYPISEFLEEKYPEISLLGNEPEERAEVRRLISWFDFKFRYEVSDNLIFEKYFKKHLGYGGPNSQAIRAGKINILYHLDYIDWLVSQRRWLAGDFFSLADITAASHISALDYLGDVPWEHNAGAKQWYQLIKSRPSFKPLLSDSVAGMPAPEYYSNLDF